MSTTRLSFETFLLPHARTYATPVAVPSAALHDAQHLALATRLERICAPLLQLEFALDTVSLPGTLFQETDRSDRERPGGLS